MGACMYKVTVENLLLSVDCVPATLVACYKRSVAWRINI